MTEKLIIKQCQQGDLKAFKWVYDRYHQPLLHTALRMLKHKEDAEDAVQLAFIKLYRGIHGFRHQSKFSTYLFRILINVCFDQIERKKKMRLETFENYHPSHKPQYELRLELEEAIQSLPEQQRACFVLFAMEDFKQDEIGVIMDLSLGGVKSNIFHAKNKLRQLLSDPKETKI